MRRVSYVVALAICSVSVAVELLATAASWFGIYIAVPFGIVFSLFASPAPALLVVAVPRVLQLTLMLMFAWLLYRRIFISVQIKTLQPPDSLAVWPGLLLSTAVGFLLVGLLVLGLSIALRAGSGVPAGMLIFQATLLLSPVMFYVELRSLPKFSKRRAPPTTQPGRDEN